MTKEDKVRYYAEITKGLIFAELSAIFAMLAFLFINFDWILHRKGSGNLLQRIR